MTAMMCHSYSWYLYGIHKHACLMLICSMCQGLGRMKASRQSWADLNSDSEDEDYARACKKAGLGNFNWHLSA